MFKFNGYYLLFPFVDDVMSQPSFSKRQEQNEFYWSSQKIAVIFCLCRSNSVLVGDPIAPGHV